MGTHRDISRLQVAQTLSSSNPFIHYIDPLSFFGLCKIIPSHSFHLQSRLVRFALTVPTPNRTKKPAFLLKKAPILSPRCTRRTSLPPAALSTLPQPPAAPPFTSRQPPAALSTLHRQRAALHQFRALTRPLLPAPRLHLP